MLLKAATVRSLVLAYFSVIQAIEAVPVPAENASEDGNTIYAVVHNDPSQSWVDPLHRTVTVTVEATGDVCMASPSFNPLATTSSSYPVVEVDGNSDNTVTVTPSQTAQFDTPTQTTQLDTPSQTSQSSPASQLPESQQPSNYRPPPVLVTETPTAVPESTKLWPPLALSEPSNVRHSALSTLDSSAETVAIASSSASEVTTHDLPYSASSTNANDLVSKSYEKTSVFLSQPTSLTRSVPVVSPKTSTLKSSEGDTVAEITTAPAPTASAFCTTCKESLSVYLQTLTYSVATTFTSDGDVYTSNFMTTLTFSTDVPSPSLTSQHTTAKSSAPAGYDTLAVIDSTESPSTRHTTAESSVSEQYDTLAVMDPTSTTAGDSTTVITRDGVVLTSTVSADPRRITRAVENTSTELVKHTVTDTTTVDGEVVTTTYAVEENSTKVLYTTPTPTEDITTYITRDGVVITSTVPAGTNVHTDVMELTKTTVAKHTVTDTTTVDGELVTTTRIVSQNSTFVLYTTLSATPTSTEEDTTTYITRNGVVITSTVPAAPHRVTAVLEYTSTQVVNHTLTDTTTVDGKVVTSTHVVAQNSTVVLYTTPTPTSTEDKTTYITRDGVVITSTVPAAPHRVTDVVELTSTQVVNHTLTDTTTVDGQTMTTTYVVAQNSTTVLYTTLSSTPTSSVDNDTTTYITRDAVVITSTTFAKPATITVVPVSTDVEYHTLERTITTNGSMVLTTLVVSSDSTVMQYTTLFPSEARGNNFSNYSTSALNATTTSSPQEITVLTYSASGRIQNHTSTLSPTTTGANTSIPISTPATTSGFRAEPFLLASNSSSALLTSSHLTSALPTSLNTTTSSFASSTRAALRAESLLSNTSSIVPTASPSVTPDQAAAVSQNATTTSVGLSSSTALTLSLNISSSLVPSVSIFPTAIPSSTLLNTGNASSENTTASSSHTASTFKTLLLANTATGFDTLQDITTTAAAANTSTPSTQLSRPVSVSSASISSAFSTTFKTSTRASSSVHVTSTLPASLKGLLDSHTTTPPVASNTFSVSFSAFNSTTISNISTTAF